jgi:hypothetical protein
MSIRNDDAFNLAELERERVDREQKRKLKTLDELDALVEASHDGSDADCIYCARRKIDKLNIIISNLRAEVGTLVTWKHSHIKDIERLRKALEQIADMQCGLYPTDDTHQLIAREALKNGQ